MQLPIGNKDSDYLLEIRVRVYDGFGASNSTTTWVKVGSKAGIKLYNIHVLPIFFNFLKSQ